jgi:tetratricopeptide (TPR) repeat protein
VDEADHNAREVVAASERIFGPDHPNTLFAKIRRAEQLREVGRNDDAVALTTYVVEHMPPEAGMPARNRYGFIGVHATALRLAGRTEESLRVMEEALAEAEREQGPLARPTTTLRSFYALALSGLDRPSDALPHYAKLLEACATSEEGTCIPINRGGTHINYAEALSKLGRHDEAVAQLDAALEILDDVLADVSPRRFDMMLVAGQILARAGRTKAARARLEEGLRIATEVEVDPKHLQQLRETLAGLD